MKTCYKEEHNLPVDVRGSKTSVLKLSNELDRRRVNERRTRIETDVAQGAEESYLTVFPVKFTV